MTDLTALSCVPCRDGAPPLPEAEKARLHAQVPDWDLVEGHHLARAVPRPGFTAGLDLVNRVGELAEREGHHPVLRLATREVRIEIWTHKIDGLTGSDFVLAAKIDRLLAGG